jgi:glycosyltransferase involved in cell wall biosynthesis
MKISVVSGFFLPVPAVAGGATEKTWARLAEEFVQAGHEVTIISRAWPQFPEIEEINGVRYRRIPGFNHSKNLALNLIKDWIWGRRVTRVLNPADIVVINTVSLPVWLGKSRPDAGKIVLTTGRVPKGQYRFYREVSLVVVNSRPVLKRIVAENPALASVSEIYGYPTDVSQLSRPDLPDPARPHAADGKVVRLGFIGRIHREKGIAQLIDALLLLAVRQDLPPWTMSICGPVSVEMGGSGERYFEAQIDRLRSVISNSRIEILPPQFETTALAKIYQSLDVFILPSLAENGETFGVANIEAMAAGCAVVTSRLACFDDYIENDVNALSYDHRSDSAAVDLAEQIARLVLDPKLRSKLTAAGQKTADRYDYANYSQRLLRDFERIVSH